MNRKQRADAFTAGLASAYALLIEHYTFQHGNRSLKPPVTYILGGFTELWSVQADTIIGWRWIRRP